MNDEAKCLQERMKRKFVSDYVDNFEKPEFYGVNDDGRFLVNLKFTHDQMAFVLLHFDSKEEFTEAFFTEINRRHQI